MIKLIDNLNPYDFKCFKDNVYFQRIVSDFKVLSVFDSSLFYVSIDGEKVNGVISKIEGNVTLALKDTSPCKEISDFLNVIGYSKILCDHKYADTFVGLKTNGAILKTKGNVAKVCKADKLYSENLKDAYDLLKEVFDIDADFADWFADISHRMRHGGARAYGIYENNILVSVGFSLFETDKIVVMSSVASKKLYRKRGYGERIVNTILSECCDKTVYVFTENKCAENWYKKLGFKIDSLWSEVENVL